ncbi:MAG: SGNH/GDSL hydrolase family protein, partial [Betaproteobacteria bacterium]
LAGAYLGAASGAAGAAAYQAFLGQQLSASALGALSPTTAGFAERAAGAYMVALADTFYSDIRTQVLARGASNVVVLNMPDITVTPRFRAVLGSVAATAGAAAATQIQGGIRAWITAFNDRLRTLAANDPRVIIIDFYGTFTQQVNSPSSFGLSNAVDTACPITGRDSQGLPSYTFPTCTDAALDATAGRTAGWWKTWLFSDSFHPTPYGHQLMGDIVIRAVRAAGWI